MRPVALFVAACLLAACGADGEPIAADQPSADQASAASASTESAQPPTEIEARRFEVDGAVVWTRTDLDALPDEATVVRFTSTLIDSGDGLELCHGGVDESLPPQCAGPVVDGLDPDGWTETASGVTWGTRTVTVAWPAVDGRLTLIADEPSLALTRIGDEPADGLPVGCEGIESFVHRDTIGAFAAANPDRTAGGRSVDNGAVVVLAVVDGHLDDVRAELTTADAEPCLEPVRYSTAQLSAAQNLLADEELYGPTGPVLSSGSGNALNRLTIGVAVADRATVESIVSRFDDPGLLHITGSGEILDGN